MKTLAEELESVKQDLKISQDAGKKHADALRAISDIAGGRPFDPNAYYYKLVLERLVGEDRFAKWFQEERLDAAEMSKRIEFHIVGVQAAARLDPEKEASQAHVPSTRVIVSMQPLTLGRIVHYYAGPEADAEAAIVTHVEAKNPYVLNGHLFSMQHGVTVVQNVPHWSVAGSGGSRWIWPPR